MSSNSLKNVIPTRNRVQEKFELHLSEPDCRLNLCRLHSRKQFDLQPAKSKNSRKKCKPIFSRKVRITFVNFRLFLKLNTNLIFLHIFLHSEKNGLHFFRQFFDFAGCKSNYFRLCNRHKFNLQSGSDKCNSYFFRP